MPTSASSSSRSDVAALDQLTGGAFTAPTAGERAARVRAWLQQEPASEQMQQVYRELSVKDKGAARLLRERLDELKRQRDQDGLAIEWAQKAQALLDLVRLNVADALAWQRDAAKAGAPLSREPLAGLKIRLAERVKSVEDLQHRVQVQREAAVLLVQRIEVLSTKSWHDAVAAVGTLEADVLSWQSEAQALPQDPVWPGLDPRFAPQLETAKAQLTLVWDAFRAALAQTQAASTDPAAELPQVPVWAEELRQARGQAAPAAAASPRPPADPESQARATAVVREVLAKLEQEITQGHGKASTGAAQALRQALKDHGRHIDAQLDRQAHAALAAAGELEGWQRWRADQLREELVAKAEGLLQRPDGQALGGRKMQETLRELREQWKQTDQGGVPNHGLWKRFDEACNQAYKVVEAWLAKIKAEAAEHRVQRLTLIEELKAWGVAQAGKDGDWRGASRELHRFSERWREAGHLSEKAFAELLPQWKTALAVAGAPLEAAQKESLQRRQAMIEEAAQLGAAATLRIDAVKALQQRWQTEAQAVPLDRRQEQKLWDAFRKPIDEAFARKSAVREQSAAALSAHDREVLQAAQALEAANAAGDAQAIRAAMAALETALTAAPAASMPPPSEASTADGAVEDGTTPAKAAQPRKPVVAVRGDDRPGAKRAQAPVPAGRGRPEDRRTDRRSPREDRAPRSVPRLGDTAFRAQREALEHAQAALRKLAAQAHGEALTQLLAAWEQRDAARVPAATELGRVAPAQRALWTQSLGRSAAGEAGEALLRLEMAAEVPTPADQLDARRALQLQLLTRRNEPAPGQTWGQDVARVLATAYGAEAARRLQQVLKILLRR